MEQKLWGWRSYLWLGLNLADAVTSLFVTEGNPFIRWLALSPQGFLVLKVLGAFLALETLFILRRMALLRVLNYLMVGVVVWNIASIMYGSFSIRFAMLVFPFQYRLRSAQV